MRALIVNHHNAPEDHFAPNCPPWATITASHREGSCLDISGNRHRKLLDPIHGRSYLPTLKKEFLITSPFQHPCAAYAAAHNSYRQPTVSILKVLEVLGLSSVFMISGH